MDHEILKDHGVFLPRALSDDLLFELNVVIGSDVTQLAYELTNVQLEYEVIHSQELADTQMGRDSCTNTSHLKTISVDRGSDTIINESINVLRRSMEGLLLFYEPYAAGARDSEKTFNPDITEVKMIVDGIPNKVYSQGMEIRDIWKEIFKRFGKENSAMNTIDFYAGDRFALSGV